MTILTDENGLYCDEDHDRINFDNWKDAEENELNHIEQYRKDMQRYEDEGIIR